ncbi:Concanavalin A-like lectin/glucanase domain [Cinara cedri]|uniref:Concanavalin A-like lectin/glucanase domain n=1 Tax=Cinara cedri TaxID=506608 RepID=A0A5E4NKY9_9HEMI|nr:Concanavalin A-like lectin/glucanase domain [Cinara cedri]
MSNIKLNVILLVKGGRRRGCIKSQRWLFIIGAILCKFAAAAADEELSPECKYSCNEHDLQEAIKVPFEDPQLYFDKGDDGFPAFGIKPGSDIKSPYRLFLPEKLYPEFSIVVNFKLNSTTGGFLFAVVNPSENVVQLGVQTVPSSANRLNVSFLYTDVNKYSSSSSNVLATFSIPWKVRKYYRLGLKVTRKNVQLFGRCLDPQSVEVIRDPMELLFDSASILYIGQAGPLIKGPFDVSKF